MIESPFAFESMVSEQDLVKLGTLTLRWSHIEYALANCLQDILRLSEKEAIIVIFPLSLEQRLNRIQELSEIKPFIPHAQAAFVELRVVMRGIQYVRNNVVHAILVAHNQDGHAYHLRSKLRTLTKSQVFGIEEWTNYAAHLARALHFALRSKDSSEPELYAWPDRPSIPDFLPPNCQAFPAQKKAARLCPP
jgi:hypothetical protein